MQKSTARRTRSTSSAPAVPSSDSSCAISGANVKRQQGQALLDRCNARVLFQSQRCDRVSLNTPYTRFPRHGRLRHAPQAAMLPPPSPASSGHPEWISMCAYGLSYASHVCLSAPRWAPIALAHTPCGASIWPRTRPADTPEHGAHTPTQLRVGTCTEVPDICVTCATPWEQVPVGDETFLTMPTPQP